MLNRLNFGNSGGRDNAPMVPTWIVGTVMNREMQPLEGVTVQFDKHLSDRLLDGTTDAMGEFQLSYISGSEKQKGQLVLRKDGFQERSVSVIVGKYAEFEFVLQSID